MKESEGKYIRRDLARLDVAPSRGRGQNFLQSEARAAQIVTFAAIEKGSPVVEVGPGLGILTQQLLRGGHNLWVVEVESALADELKRRLPALLSERIILRDVRKLSLDELFDVAQGELGEKKWSVISNVPYSISTDFILWLFKNSGCIAQASLLLQREFAERIAAGPGGRAYGSLSVLRILYAEAELGPVIPGTEFVPPAKVESRLVKLTFRDRHAELPCAREEFERIVRAAFSQKRKMLRNTLLQLFADDREVLEGVFATAKIEPSRRAESLSFEEFVSLAAAVAARAS